MAASFASSSLLARLVRVDDRLAVLHRGRIGRLRQHGDRRDRTRDRRASPRGRLRGRHHHAVRDAGGLPLPVDRPWLGLSERRSGLWAGVAVHDTSQVVADRRRLRAGGARCRDRGQAHPQRADGTAPLADRRLWAAGRRYAGPRPRRDGRSGRAAGRAGAHLTARLDRSTGIAARSRCSSSGFLALAALRSVGLIDADQAAALDTVAPSLRAGRARRRRDVDPVRRAA